MYRDFLLFDKFVTLYGLMIAIGICAAFGVLYLYAKKTNLDRQFADFIFFNGIAAIVIGFGSAALFQATYNYIAHPENGFNLGEGMTFIGGLIGGIICFLAGYFIMRKRLKTRLYEAVSLIPCMILIGHAFGRIGCFFGGCCYGKPTDSFLGVQFPFLSTPVHPTMLYEAAFLFIMFAVCSLLLLKWKFKHNLSLYLVSYGIFRFLIEYLRGDDRGNLVGFISPSQFWSIFMVIGGVAVYFYVKYLYKKNGDKSNA